MAIDVAGSELFFLCCAAFLGCQGHEALSSCLGLARAASNQPPLSRALRSAVNCLIELMEIAAAGECADLLRDDRTCKLLPLIMRKQAQRIVERRWRALLDEPDVEFQEWLLQQVSRPEVEQIVSMLLNSNDESKVRPRCKERPVRGVSAAVCTRVVFALTLTALDLCLSLLVRSARRS